MFFCVPGEALVVRGLPDGSCHPVVIQMSSRLLPDGSCHPLDFGKWVRDGMKNWTWKEKKKWKTQRKIGKLGKLRNPSYRLLSRKLQEEITCRWGPCCSVVELLFEIVRQLRCIRRELEETARSMGKALTQAASYTNAPKPTVTNRTTLAAKRICRKTKSRVFLNCYHPKLNNTWFWSSSRRKTNVERKSGKT
jgi:hypothetical protein